MKNNKVSNDKEITPPIFNYKYHTIPIRTDLPKIEKSYRDEDLQYSPPNDFWVMKLDANYTNETDLSSQQPSLQSVTTQKYEIQYSTSNGPYTSYCKNHPILTAFLRAYNSHEDIIFSPDDIWLMICIYFAQYVNHNSRKVHTYIRNQINKLLTVEDELKVECDWESFLQQIHTQITDNIENDICQVLTNSFSTTTKVESLLSSLTIMSTFKKCTDYTYTMHSCGIRNVHFMGSLDDWIMLRDKSIQLKSFTEDDDEFCTYLNGIFPILNQFIETYKGNVDNHFWDTIFDLNHSKDESMNADGIHMNGWFRQLCFGQHTNETCLVSCIKMNCLIVPVTVENEHTNTSKVSYLIGGFHGVLSHDEMHKPVLSLIIIDDMKSISQLKEHSKHCIND